MIKGKEIWMEIEGYPCYQVSNMGRVKSSIKYKRGIFLKPGLGGSRYNSVSLCNDLGKKTHLIHRLVATAFIQNHSNKPEVNHIDGNRLNNYYRNLEWVTSSENQRHAFDTGLQSGNNGESNGMSKLKESDIINIRSEYKKGSVLQKDLAKKYGVAKSAICWIIKGKYWSHI